MIVHNETKRSLAFLHRNRSIRVLLFCRVRKRFRIENVGSGPLEVTADSRAPWALVTEAAHGARCGAGCGCAGGGAAGPREAQLTLHLLPRSSMEVRTNDTILFLKSCQKKKNARPISRNAFWLTLKAF